MRALLIVLLTPTFASGQALEFVRAPDGARLEREERINTAPVLPQATAIVKFDPRRERVRVVVDCADTPIEHVRCDVGLSESLVELRPRPEEERVIVIRQPDQPEQPEPVLFEILAMQLRVGEEARLRFNAGIRDEAAVGLRVKVSSRRRQVILDLEPGFILASGVEDSLSNRGIARAVATVGSTEAEIARLRTFASDRRLTDGISVEQRNQASQAARNLQRLKAMDESTLQRIGSYAAWVYEEGSVYVRVYAGNRTLAGTVR